MVVVTKGEEGAVAFRTNSSIEVPVFPVTVVDAVGAGDSYMAGLLFALQRSVWFY